MTSFLLGILFGWTMAFLDRKDFRPAAVGMLVSYLMFSNDVAIYSLLCSYLPLLSRSLFDANFLTVLLHTIYTLIITEIMIGPCLSLAISIGLTFFFHVDVGVRKEFIIFILPGFFVGVTRCETDLLFLQLSFPLLMSLVVHAIMIRFNLFQSLFVPIDGGEGVFGNNKTYRGFLAAVIGCSSGFVILCNFSDILCLFPHHFTYASTQIVFGATLGMMVMLSELPNSFIKRRLRIPSGQDGGTLCDFIDQVDIMLGFFLTYGHFIDVRSHVLPGLCICYICHKMVTALSISLGMKKRLDVPTK